MVRYIFTLDAASIPTGSGGASITVEEDIDASGSVDNSDTVALVDGQQSYETADVFAGEGEIRVVWNLGPPSDVESVAATTVPVEFPTPNAPSNLTVTSVTDTPSVVLSWQDVANEGGYRIYRSTSPGTVLGDYTQIDTNAQNDTTYTDTTVSLNTRYYYVVTAVNGGESTPSNEVRAEPNSDDLTESVSWDSETEWGYGSFTDTGTDGSGVLLLGANPNETFDWTLQSSTTIVTVTVTVEDANTNTTLATEERADIGTISGSFTIDTTQHPDLRFIADINDQDEGTGGSAELTEADSGEVLASVTTDAAFDGSKTDSSTQSYPYEDSGTWTSPYWDYTNTTTATQLSWGGVTLPSGTSVSVDVATDGGGATTTVSLTAGSGSQLIDLPADDRYSLTVSLSGDGDNKETPVIDALTLEAHTPTTNHVVTDTRATEVDLSWSEVSVCDGYEVYQSTSTPVTPSDSLAYSNTDSSVTSTTISGLTEGETYYYNVRCIYSGE